MDYRERDGIEYIQGNVVRRAGAAPAYEPQAPEKSKEQLRIERARKARIKQNQQREMAMNRGYVLFLSLAIAVCSVMCISLIRVQSDITHHLSTIAGIETQLEHAREENAATANRIDTMMNLEDVKARADRLGMTYPSAEQIEYYSVDSVDYMNQFAEIQ